MRRYLFVFCLSQLVFSAPFASADPYTAEYNLCKERCVKDYADCLKEVPTEESPAKTAITTTCTMENKACNADCDEMKTVTGLLKKVLE